MTDLFGHAPPHDPDTGKRARAFKTNHRHLMRRAKSEAALAEILPDHLETAATYHIISHGDVDSLSYLAHILKAQPLDYLMISTWVMGASDVKLLERWLDEGLLTGKIDFNFGEHMTGEYGDIFAAAAALAAYTGGSAKIARNHSKIMLMANASADYWCVSESSANINTNPRIEQTVLTRDRDLYEFYREFFDGVRSIQKK